jgi:hypothetical protein
VNEQAAEVEDLFYHTMTDTRYPEGGWKVAMVTTGGNVSAYNQLAQTKLRTWGETYRVLTISMMAVDPTQDLATAAGLSYRDSQHFLKPPASGLDWELGPSSNISLNSISTGNNGLLPATRYGLDMMELPVSHINALLDFVGEEEIEKSRRPASMPALVLSRDHSSCTAG